MSGTIFALHITNTHFSSHEPFTVTLKRRLSLSLYIYIYMSLSLSLSLFLSLTLSSQLTTHQMIASVSILQAGRRGTYAGKEMLSPDDMVGGMDAWKRRAVVFMLTVSLATIIATFAVRADLVCPVARPL